MSKLPTRVNLAVDPHPPHLRPPQIPPLRVYHLLALTAVAAVILTRSRPSFDALSRSESLRHFQHIFTSVSVAYSFCVSFAITATVFGLLWRRYGINYPFHPGHWLLVVFSASYLLLMLVGIAIPSELLGRRSISFVSNLLSALLDIYIGRKYCLEARWSRAFYAKAFAAIVPVLGDMLLLIMLSRAGLGDRDNRIQRDWLHRAGVVIQILGSLLMVGVVVAVIVVFMIRM
jgi:hypothetical protein